MVPRPQQLLVLLTLFAGAHGDPDDQKTPQIPLWPWPASITSGAATAAVSSTSFKFTANSTAAASSPARKDLEAALLRYEGYAFGAAETAQGSRAACPRGSGDGGSGDGGGGGGGGSPGLLTGLSVTVTGPDAPLAMGSDESYTLRVPADGAAECSSRTTVGALRCLETFHQLLQFAAPASRTRSRSSSPPSNPHHCDYVIMALPLLILDAPRFTHRGLLVDTGRDFYSVTTLRRVIETLSMNKLSVLHWHITEVDAFPLELAALPQLAGAGAFASNQRYSRADVAELVAWGRACGVRVVPEVDMPGHMSAFNLSLPGIATDTGARHHEADYGIANFASPLLLPTVGALVAEVAGMFEDELFFVGGDETACSYNECDYRGYANQTERCPHMATAATNWTCPVSGWMADAGVAAWAAAHSTATRDLRDHAALFTYFADHVEPLLAAHNKTAAWWNDRYDTMTDRPDHASPPPRSRPIVENWLRSGPAALTPYLRDGWRVWQGAGWYLGTPLAGFAKPKTRVPGLTPGGGETCVFGPSLWMDFYAQEPHRNATGATATELELLLGGEASAWGDCISAETFEAMAWPTASAVAERLWSPKERNNVTEAFGRLAAFRCSMVRRGVRAAPLHPGSCWGAREID